MGPGKKKIFFLGRGRLSRCGLSSSKVDRLVVIDHQELLPQIMTETIIN